MLIEDYVDNLDDFDKLSAKEQIRYISYFYLISENVNVFKPLDIINLFTSLHLKTPKNIPQIISNNCASKIPIFIRKEGGFTFNRNEKKKIR